MHAILKSSLSESRRRFLELMQRVHFGRIEQLAVRASDPVFDPPPRAVQTIKVSGGDAPRPHFAAVDFVLKNELVRFFAELDAIGDGTILVIEVAHGLPLFFEIEQSVIL